MFVARSARRIRLARAAFLLGGLLPCAVLATWAVHRQSAAHREAIRGRWEQAVGLPISVAAIEHPLPGAVRARGCAMAAAHGGAVLAAERVDVVSTPTEVRVGIATLECDPPGAAALAALAGEWLERGARFRRDVVVDVAEFSWLVVGRDGRPERRPLGAIRIECVAKEGGRAVRIVRRDADDGADEVRIVRAATEGDANGPGRLDLEAMLSEPVPMAILAAVVAEDGPLRRLSLGSAALVSGRLTAARAGGGWSGTATGRIVGVDLAACTAGLPAGASGCMDLDVAGLAWRDGRLESADVVCAAAGGRVDRRLLESLVATVGCRPGPAYGEALADREFGFEAFGCRMCIDGRGIGLSGVNGHGGSLAHVDGRSLLDPPANAVPIERLVWLLAAPDAVYVPSSGAGAWLMSWLPGGGGSVGRTSRAESSASGGF